MSKYAEAEYNRLREVQRDKCVSCNADTEYDEFEHIDFRHFYIEGAGQLCADCYNKLYGKKEKE